MLMLCHSCFHRFVPKIEQAIEYMKETEMEISEEVKESVKGSLKYAQIITSELCREEEPEMPACVPPPTAETRACDPMGAITSCVSSAAIMNATGLVTEAEADDSKKDEACRWVYDVP